MRNGKNLIKIMFVMLAFAFFLPWPDASADGKKTNILIYMIASDLETENAAATKDIEEMIEAAKNFPEETELFVYAGGAKQWHNDIFSSKENRCVRIDRNGVEFLYAEPDTDMANPYTLGEFIFRIRVEQPADRSILILWDHGGGIFGFGLDEQIENSRPMTPSDIAEALHYGSTQFDIVGFDACMMASYEVAFNVAAHGKYMVASQEMEPVGGWDYEAWLGEFAKDPGKDALEICKTIVDTYMEWCKVHAPSIKDTLSVIDLPVLIEKVPPALTDFSVSMLNDLTAGKYDIIHIQKTILNNVCRRSSGSMIDAVEFVGSMEGAPAKKLEKALLDAVVYNRRYPKDLKANGLLIYLSTNTATQPEINVKDLQELESFGVNESYAKYISCIQRYVKIARGEQEERTLMDIFNHNDRYDDALNEAVEDTRLDVSDCYITFYETHGYTVPKLYVPEEKKKLILCVGERYIGEKDGKKLNYGELYFSLEEDTDEYMDYWKSLYDDWLYINDVLCPFYMEQIIKLNRGRVALYGYTGMSLNGNTGMLYLRIVYDHANEAVSIEPICYQEIYKEYNVLQFGRVIPVSELNEEDRVVFSCYDMEKEDNVTPTPVMEEMAWKDVKKIEMKTMGEENIDFAFFAVDLYGKYHDFQIRK